VATHLNNVLPFVRRNLVVAADFGQISVYSAPADDDARQPLGEPDRRFLLAMNDAFESGRYIGTYGREVVSLVTPGQWNWQTPLRLEVWPVRPPVDASGWDHEVDVDLDVTADRLCFLPGGWSGEPVTTDVPAGKYRARISGRGFELVATGADVEDSYRLQLFPRRRDTAPSVRKQWPGWDAARSWSPMHTRARTYSSLA
jgi:hypothetical protein